MTEEKDRDEAEKPAEDERGIHPVMVEGPDVKAAIDEAVEAVEAVTRRRQGDELDSGNGVPSGEASLVEEEVDELRDRLLRTLADFDNFRKRVDRERADDRKYGAVGLLREILGVVDNLERALASEGDLDDLRQGVEMTLRQMEDALRKSGVEEVAALDEEFDPAVHEAVSRVEDAEIDVPKVIDEMQRGYTVYERLLRPAIVRVAVPVRGVREDEELEQEATSADEDTSASEDSSS